jgi:hypothetical protein
MDTAGAPFCFEANEVVVRQTDFGGVFNDKDEFVGRNEARESCRERSFPRTRSAADGYVLARKHIIFKTIGKAAVERPRSDQVFDFEISAAELADRERNAREAARRKDRSHTAAVRQSRVENGLGFRDVVAGLVAGQVALTAETSWV